MKGINSLSNAELLAIIISTGTKEKSALDLGYELLNRFGSISGLANLSIDELISIKGIQEAKAVRLAAAFALLSRYENELREKRFCISSIHDILNLLIPKCINLQREFFFLVYLTKKNELIRVETLYQGTKDTIPLSVSEIIRSVFKAGANRVYIAHNHPSNQIEPSQEDVETFNTLSLFLGTCGIDLVDSIIIGRNESYSCVKNERYQNCIICNTHQTINEKK